ncbi:MAG: DUF4982 domain-containing protein [Cyclobacteriaceae bacterium]
MLTLISCESPQKTQSQRDVDFNFDWKFTLVEDSSSTLESSASFDDENWNDVRLPHDWSVEFSFDPVKGEGCTGYLPGGTGWYRKTFDKSVGAEELAYIYFDGVYNNSEVWINGKKLGSHPYGYTPFYYEISSYLNGNGKDNVIAVKVDRTRYADSRWYTGSGIYRNVKLITTNKLHVPIWGTFLKTPEVSAESASLTLDVKVKNAFSESADFELLTEIYNPSGTKVADKKDTYTVDGREQGAFVQEMKVQTPALWDTENPNMYKAITSVVSNGKVVDKYETPFGIRSIRFDKDEGFFLNEKNMKIKGVCLHHDAGIVGAAVPDGVWRRRFEVLKEGGCNAIRISHNPGSESFLQLCDEMGILVQDEFFDEWDNPKDKRLNKWETKVDYVTRGYVEHFQEWAERDLKTTIMAHANHPSIIQWSIGNEIEWTYPRYSNATGFFNMDWKGNYFWSQPPIAPDQIKKRYEESEEGDYVLAETAQKLADWTREMDVTRPVIANCILPSASHVTGYADALDIVGYSYRRVLYDYGHKYYPDKVIMGTENLGQWHEWKAIEERPFISGTFLWTGIDYMGESNGSWPKKGTASGLIDLAGFPKGSYHMLKTLWNDDPHIHIATQNIERSINKIDEKTGLLVARDPDRWEETLWVWQNVNNHWNYESGAMISVELYSNCEEIELFLNDKSLGKRSLSEFKDHIYKWAVPYAAGELKAKGTIGGKEVEETLISASAPASIKLTIDKTELTADGYDVAHIIAQLVDEKGNPIKHMDKKLTFSIDGDVKLLGVDNGSITNVQDFQSNELVTSQGRSLMIIQSNLDASSVKITATSEGIESAEVALNVIK